MAAFATPTELAGFLQQDLDTYSATQALDVASQNIRTACGWNISQETVTAQEFDGTGNQSIFINTLNLTAVSSVVVDGVALASTDFRFYRYGWLRRLYSYWPCFPEIVTVTYTHGYATIPDDVKGACLVLAGAKYETPGGAIRSRTDTVGSVTESRTFATGVPATLVPVDDPEAVIARYKLPGMA